MISILNKTFKIDLKDAFNELRFFFIPPFSLYSAVFTLVRRFHFIMPFLLYFAVFLHFAVFTLFRRFFFISPFSLYFDVFRILTCDMFL